MTADTQKDSGKLGWLPGATAILAFLACNCAFILVAVLSVFGITIAINPHVQAAMVSLFAVLTLGFVLLNYRKHRVPGPMILSVLGAVLVVGTMYISFNKIIETVGLLALIASAIWSWRAGKASVRSPVTS